MPPVNKGRPWDEEQDAELRQRLGRNETVGEIARAMQRTQDAIRGRAWELRLTLNSALRPWRDTVSRRKKRAQRDQ
jgi:hypothetical protein